MNPSLCPLNTLPAARANEGEINTLGVREERAGFTLTELGKQVRVSEILDLFRFKDSSWSIRGELHQFVLNEVSAPSE